MKMYDSSIRKAIEELESLEARQQNLEEPLFNRARWVGEQLQLTPWHISHECVTVSSRAGQRKGFLFSVVGFGDPSGGHGEAVSLLRMQIGDVTHALQVAELQRLTDDELLRALQTATNKP